MLTFALDQVARLLGVDPGTVLAWIEAGELQAVRYREGGAWFIGRDHLHAFLRARGDPLQLCLWCQYCPCLCVLRPTPCETQP